MGRLYVIYIRLFVALQFCNLIFQAKFNVCNHVVTDVKSKENCDAMENPAIVYGIACHAFLYNVLTITLFAVRIVTVVYSCSSIGLN